MDEARLERIPRLSWADFKRHLTEKKPFEAVSPMGTAFFRVARYEPCLALAVHAGHRVREELLLKMAIEETDRAFEEDLGVEEFIADLPMQIIALDSRYEYDLNRARGQAVYLKPFQSWGKKVWQVPPSKEELDISYQKYDEFQEMLDYLVEQLTALFGRALVLDVHSYNHRRPNQQAKPESFPTFDLATSTHDQEKHRKIVDAVAAELRAFALPNLTVTVKENGVFKKDGAIASLLEPKYPESLILPIEIKKIYLDETTREVLPATVSALRKGFNHLHRQILKGFFS